MLRTVNNAMPHTSLNQITVVVLKTVNMLRTCVPMSLEIYVHKPKSQTANSVTEPLIVFNVMVDGSPIIKLVYRNVQINCLKLMVLAKVVALKVILYQVTNVSNA